MAWRFFVILLCVWWFDSFLLVQSNLEIVEVDTNVGPIAGFRYKYDVDSSGVQFSKNINTFLGIPFAEAPVADLRFKKPVGKTSWTEPWNATFDRPMCWQLPVDLSKYPPQDEDCLYLNIWSPDVERTNLPGLPVMVWIHGGAFVTGTGSGPYYDGLSLAAFNDVVVVTLNYRLSAFGFLYAGNASKGNFGIWDQNLALKWVKNNIEEFGGDSNNITIFGQSAGGVSVGLHLLAEQSQDLFDRAILMSGSMLHPWGVELDKEKALSDAYKVAGNTICRNVENDDQLVDCFRGLPARILINAALTSNVPFLPVVDNELLTDDPKTLLQQGKFKQCPIMTGATKDDGSYWGLIPFASQIAVSNPYINYTEFQHVVSEYTFVHNTPQVSRAIEQEYVDWSHADDVSANYFDTYIQLITDEALYCPVDEVARIFRKQGNIVYKYLFNHVPSRSIYSLVTLPTSIWEWRGVAHAEDVAFVFGCPFFPNWFHNYTDEEKVLSLDMMRYYTNFAKTGDPNLGGDNGGSPGQEVNWDEFNFPELKLMELKPSSEVIMGYNADQCHFWREYVPGLVTCTADVQYVQKEWQQEFNSWKSVDVVGWRGAFDQHLKETEGCGDSVN